MKLICTLVLVVWSALSFLPPEALAQSEQEGIAIRKEADELRIKARSTEDREKALQKYQQALEIFRKANSEKWQAITLNNIGLVYVGRSKYQEALGYYEESLDLHRKVGNVKGEATTLANVGLVYRNLGQFQKALEYQERALTLHRQVSNLQGEGWALLAMGYTYTGAGQHDKALECKEKALEISRELKNVMDEGNALLSIGHSNKDMGDYQKALENYGRALEIHKKTGNVQAEGNSLSGIGQVYLYLGQYKKALEYLDKALDIQLRLGNEREQSIALNDIAFVFQAQGQYQKALVTYEKSLEITRKIGERKLEANTLNNIAGIYLRQGQYQKALEWCNRSLEINRKIGSNQGEAWTCAMMGSIYHASGQRESALANYERASEITRKIGDQRGESNNYASIGRVCFSFGKYDDALKYYQTALEIKTKVGLPTDEIRSLIAWTYMENGELAKAEDLLKEAKPNWALGKLHLLKLEYDKSKTAYEKLLASAENSGNVENLFTAYTGLGRVYEGLEDYAKAEEYYEKGMKLTEEMRSGLLPPERKTFFDVKVQGFERSESAKGLTRVRMKLNRAAQSIDSSEVTRARAFSDGISLRSELGVAGVPKDILRKEADLVAKGAALKTERGKVEKEKNPERYSNITKEVEAADGELNSFVEMLRNKYTSYAAVKYPRPVTLKESSLGPDEHVVIFDVSTEGVGVKLIKGKPLSKPTTKGGIWTT